MDRPSDTAFPGVRLRSNSVLESGRLAAPPNSAVGTEATNSPDVSRRRSSSNSSSSGGGKENPDANKSSSKEASSFAARAAHRKSDPTRHAMSWKSGDPSCVESPSTPKMGSARRASTKSVTKPLKKSRSSEGMQRLSSQSTMDIVSPVPIAVAPKTEYQKKLLITDESDTYLRVRDILCRERRNPVWLQRLTEFAKKTHNGDILLFWLLHNAMLEKPSMKDKIAAHLIKCYIREGAPSEINVSSRMRRELLHAYTQCGNNNVPVELFAKVIKEVEQMIEQNMGSFFHDKRAFWKRQVAWNKKDTATSLQVPTTSPYYAALSRGRVLSEGSITTNTCDDSIANDDEDDSAVEATTPEVMNKWLSGGDESLEKALQSSRGSGDLVEEVIDALRRVTEEDSSS